MRSHVPGRGVVLASLFVMGCTQADVDEANTGEVTQASAASGASGTPPILTSLSGTENKIEITSGGHKAEVKGAVNLVLQDLTILPGGHTGWHSHGGPVLVSLLSGSLTVFSADDPCGAGETYVAEPTTAPSAFVDPGGDHVHIARNLGSTTTVVRVTYILPVGASPRIDRAAPSACP